LPVEQGIGHDDAAPPTVRNAVNTENAPWLALWTHSHAEQLVHDQLIAKAFHSFLPMIPVWSRRAGVQRLIRRPMFPGYLFLRHPLDKASYIEILKTNGLVRILGERWDRPAIVAHAEIVAIRQVLDAGLPILPHPYLREGHRVRITQGPLEGIEGVLLYDKVHKGLLVVSVSLLRRSVAVEVDCMVVAPVGDPVAAVARPPSRARPASSPG